MANITKITGLNQYTEADFETTAPRPGEGYLLFSGSVTPFVDWGATLEGSALLAWSFSTEGNTSSYGTANVGSTLKGITLSNYNLDGGRNDANFRLCTSLLFTFTLGTSTLGINVDIENRKFYPSYTYFKVSQSFADALENIVFKFKCKTPDSTGSAKYMGYECIANSGNVIEISIQPFYNPGIDSDFNPILNNVTGSVANSVAQVVETRTYIAGSGGDQHLVTEELLTVFASIPDSYFTSIANMSGRFLGSKNALYSKYCGFKQSFSDSNRTLVDSASVYVGDEEFPNSVQRTGSLGLLWNVIETGKDRPFFTVQGFTGSVYTADTSLEAVLSMSISDMQLDTLTFAPASIYESGSVTVGEVTYTVPPSVSVTKPNTLPQLGDILYNGYDPEYRLVKSKVYVPDLGSILLTDKYGHVHSIVSLPTPAA